MALVIHQTGHSGRTRLLPLKNQRKDDQRSAGGGKEGGGKSQTWTQKQGQSQRQ